MRSPPTQRTMSLPEFREGDVEVGESSKKRKEVTPPSVSAKRIAEEGETSDAEEIEVFPTLGSEMSQLEQQFDEIKKISARMTHWAVSQHKSKKLLVSQQNEVMKNMERIGTLTRAIEVKMAYMNGRLDERTKIEEILTSGPERVDAPRATTFAEAVKVPKITGITRVQTPKILFVKSADDKQTLDEVKNVIKSTIRPSKMGINIKRVTKTARGIMIETEGMDQLEKLSGCQALKDKGLVFDKPKKRNPRVMIYDVELPEDQGEFVEDVYAQNFGEAKMDLETFRNEFRYVHKYKKKDPKDTRVSLVIETSARVRNLLRMRDRIFIGWQSCRLKDYNPLVRCFKCQAFGHVSKYCKGQNVCPHCAEDHVLTECPNKEKPLICPNCTAAKKDANHAISNPKCPEFIRATKIAYERIDYGN